MSKVTIIVPVYKVEPYLRRCVDSILAQTFTDFDLVLVDDGSPDNCGAICDEYAAKDGRITVIHKQNGGLSDARNAGIDRAFANSSSDWLTFIDSDDWVHPEYLEALLNANLKNGTEISMGEVLVTPEYTLANGDPSEKVTVETANDAFRDESLDPSSCCCRVFKKELFREIRFPVGKLHEDTFITYRLYFQFDRVSVVHFPLYYYFVNSAGIVHSGWNPKKLDVLEAVENQIAYFGRIDNQEMRSYALNNYIRLLVYNLKEAKKDSRYASYDRQLRKKLRKTLRTYKKELGLSFSKNFNTCKYAYPLTAKIYRRLKRI